jgi:hypothetical protein
VFGKDCIRWYGSTLFPGILLVIVGDAVICIRGSPNIDLRFFFTKFPGNPLIYGLKISITSKRLFQTT